MTILQFHDASGTPIDARFEVRAPELILHSRGGAASSPAARNTKYGPAMRLLLTRIARSRLCSTASGWTALQPESSPSSSEGSTFLSTPVLHRISCSRGFRSGWRPSPATPSRRRARESTKRLRISFAGAPTDEEIVRVAGWGETDAASSRGRPLPARGVQPRDCTAHLERGPTAPRWPRGARLRCSSRSGGVARSICARNWRNSRGAMAPGDPSEHLPGRDVERRIQIRGPVALVVVGAALDLPGAVTEGADGSRRAPESGSSRRPRAPARCRAGSSTRRRRR